MSKEIITKIELQTGYVAANEADLPKTTDPEEFVEYALKNNFTGVNYDARTKFLKANGYELTRKNLIDSYLPSKPPKKSKK